MGDNIFKRRRRIGRYEIDPDEVLLDASNLPSFDTDQFEGRLERPIGKRALFFLSTIFLLLGAGFLFRLFDLQVVNGSEYKNLSENNTLSHIPIFPERGVIYDRNNLLLAWNESADDDQEFPDRVYRALDGIAHVVGYVSYPKKDSSGRYYELEFTGKAGIEREYQNDLSGNIGTKISETDVHGNVTSESLMQPPENGTNITLTIDAELTSALYGYIHDLARDIGFQGGAGVIIGVHTGKILALTSYPEYDPNVISAGTDSAAIKSAFQNARLPFLNRAISGLYTPGSTVKPFFGVAALAENIISPTKKILSTGSISIPNPYNPDLKTVFNDWKAHGWVDVREALAVSSNVYFFEVGGGYEDQPGLGIERLEKYARMFGLGEATDIDLPGEVEGIIPNQKWKEENFPDDPWRIGDTYNTAIGQYGFQITPLQLARADAAIANGGTLVVPHLLEMKGDLPYEGKIVEGTLSVPAEDMQIVREGMRLGVTEGISQALSLPFVKVAAKTGTAEVGAAKIYANSWISGFFPYENPHYAFAVVMERGPRSNTRGAVFTMRSLLEWMAMNRPEYLK